MADREPKYQGYQEVHPDSTGLARIDEFLQVTTRYRSQFIWIVRRMTGCTDEAEDIVQGAFMKAYANLHRYRGEARLSTWLRTIVVNAARDHLRNRQQREIVSLEFESEKDGKRAAMECRDPQLSPEEYCAQRQIFEVLLRELSHLSSYSRRAIQMCILEGRSRAEAATTLNASIASIKARISRGKRHLHHSLLSLEIRRSSHSSLIKPREFEARGRPNREDEGENLDS